MGHDHARGIDGGQLTMTMLAENSPSTAPETLWVTDAELIRRSGIPSRVARRLLRELDRLPSGFPRKDKLCGNRRYWPAVKDFFAERTAKLSSPNRRDRQ